MYRVADVMTREVVALSVSDSLAKAEAYLHMGHIRHLPVLGDEGLVGLVTRREVVRARAQGATDGVPVGEAMQASLMTVAPELRLTDAARLMLEHKIGCLPVLESDRLVGIITESDFLRFALMVIEELDDGVEALETARISIVET